MILRKPYAFLIKNFKLIHLVLTILIGVILYKTNKLLTFFNQYLSSGSYEVIDNLSSEYIGIYMYILIFIILGISGVIFHLMYKKDKPVKYYLILIIYYIFLIGGLLFVSNALNNIGFNKIDVLMLNISRDILLVLYLIQIPIIIVSIARTVGFNIKKFNFQRDLIELQVDEKDNEEFELDVDIDSDDVKARFKRRKRMIGYVIKENKLLITILIIIVLIISGFIFYNTVYKNNFVYKENKKFTDNNIEMKVIDSYQLDTDSFGNDISKDKYSYVVVRVNAKNIAKIDKKIVLKSFTLKIKNKIYNVSTKDKDKFKVLGTSSDNITLTSREETNFIVIFKIDKGDKNKEKILEYAGSYSLKGNERVYNVNRIKLKTKSLGNNKVISKVGIGEELKFNNNILNNSSIVINSYDIQDKYTYTYQQCIDECYTFNDYIVPKVNTKYNITIMRLDFDLKIDEELNNSKLKDEFISTVAHLRYVINGKEYKQKFNIEDITPNVVKDYKYYEVKGEVKNAESIYLDFVILDKVYTYVLKETA